MTGQWHGGKGDAPRKSQITETEKELRWELAFGKPSEERKERILKMLEDLKK